MIVHVKLIDSRFQVVLIVYSRKIIAVKPKKRVLTSRLVRCNLSYNLSNSHVFSREVSLTLAQSGQSGVTTIKDQLLMKIPSATPVRTHRTFQIVHQKADLGG